MSNMKLLMENWNKFVNEDDEGASDNELYDELFPADSADPDNLELPLEEAVGVGTIALGVVLGIIAYKGIGVLARGLISSAEGVLQIAGAVAEEKARVELKNLTTEYQKKILNVLEEDEEITWMIERYAELTEIVENNKGARSPELAADRRERRSLSKEIPAAIEKAFVAYRANLGQDDTEVANAVYSRTGGTSQFRKNLNLRRTKKS